MKKEKIAKKMRAWDVRVGDTVKGKKVSGRGFSSASHPHMRLDYEDGSHSKKVHVDKRLKVKRD